MSGRAIMVGSGKLAITPPFGCEMSGFVARRGRAAGVHDPLWAKALVISDGREKLALVVADLIGVDSEIVSGVRALTSRLTDIPPSHVVVGATHTHSGPAVLRRGYLGEADPAYLDCLAKNLAGSVVLANRTLEPVHVLAGRGECRIVGKNRRKPGGPTDPEVLVLRFEGKAGTKALLVNYACHPVVLGPDNLLISADYPFYLTSLLEQVYPGAQVMFVSGAAGDINVGHHARASIDGPGAGGSSRRTFAEAMRLGRILAGEALRASETAGEPGESEVKLASRKVTIPLEPVPSVSEFEAAASRWEERAGELKAGGAGYGEVQEAIVWARWAREMGARRASGSLDPGVPVEVAAFRVAGCEFVTLPGEFFHELGLAAKKARSPRRVFILGYSNGSVGYVPTSSAYDEGGYEVEESYRYYGLPSKLARGGGEEVVEVLVDLLKGL